ncbi:MAG: DoxX family protein [Gemmatimonadales bacterium]
MHILLWTLQVLAACLYLASGVMKAFMFDRIKDQVPSFGALPRQGWATLGIIELAAAAGLVLPSALHWHPVLTVVAATVLALESLIFIGVHVKYRETGSIIMSGALGLVMAFVAWGRHALAPIL